MDEKANSDCVLKALKWCVFASLLFMPLSTGLAYIAYSGDLAVSALPWRISVAVMFLCCVVPVLLYSLFRRKSSLVAYGVIGLFAMCPIYYFFGIFGYFYFFIFSPIQSAMKWIGIAGGITVTTYWIYLVARNVQSTINDTRFVAAAFTDRGDGVVLYQVQRGMRIFEKHFVEPSPFPKPLVYVVFAIAPFCLVLPRILSSVFGTNGVLFVFAALGFPMSLWLIGLLVRIYLVTVALPLRIERERHMRVIVEA